eukprot:2065561-Rhodomonas_salina.1
MLSELRLKLSCGFLNLLSLVWRDCGNAASSAPKSSNHARPQYSLHRNCAFLLLISEPELALAKPLVRNVQY